MIGSGIRAWADNTHAPAPSTTRPAISRAAVCLRLAISPPACSMGSRALRGALSDAA